MSRPPKYKTVKQLENKINEYFEYCDSKKKPYTVSGLAYYLGYTSRQVIYDMGQREQFSYTIKKAKLRIESNIEELGLLGKINPTFAIFNLKNNFKWKDKQEVEHSGECHFEFIECNNIEDVKRSKKLYNEECT